MAEQINGIPVSRTKLFTVASNCYETTKGLENLDKSGLSPEYYAAFAANILNAKNFKTAEEVAKANAKKLTEVKKKCGECYDWVKNLQFYLKRAFGVDSPEWNEFPENVTETRRDPAEMINMLPAAFTLADKYAAKLTAKGMPAGYKETGAALMAELDAVNKEHGTMVQQSETYTLQRNLAHRRVYDTVNEINELGRRAYKDDPVTLKLFDSPWAQSKAKEKEPPPETPATN